MLCADTTSPLTVGSSSRLTMLSSQGIGTPPSRRRRSTSTMVGPSSACSRSSAAASASPRAGRSAWTTRSSSGWPSTRAWSWPNIRVMAAETDCTVPARSSRRRMLAELWTRDRKRSMSLVATSQRRRSVRSRRHHTSPSMGGLPTTLAPISSTSFQPVGVWTRSSMESRRSCPARSPARRRPARRLQGGGIGARWSRRSPRWTARRAAPPRGCPTPDCRPLRHDDGVGRLQGEMLQPRRFHCPFPSRTRGIGPHEGPI